MAKEISVPKVNIPMDRIFIAEKDIYQETEAKARERFGKNSQAYKTTMNGINPNNGTGSQFFFNTEVGLHLPKNQRVILFEDLERILSSPEANEFFDGSFYIDTPELILRTEIPTYEKNKHILKDLVKQIKDERLYFSSESPLRISGLELIKDDNPQNKYGILLKISQDTKTTNDERFGYQKNTIQIGNKEKILYTKTNGLSGVPLSRYGYLNSDDDNLAGSNDNGRVGILDAEGVVASENLEQAEKDYKKLKKDIERRKKDLISKIQKL